tara:strand:- start:985 stop:1779 length:795 start_codon:yes stop_codon:yes gene_type:complete
MCDPVSITLGVATAGLGVAQAASSASAANRQADARYRSQYRQAAAQNEHANRVAAYNNERYRLAIDYQQRLAQYQSDTYYSNAENIGDSLEAQYGAVFEQIEQSRSQTLTGIDRASRNAQKGASAVTVAASETGTTGNSIALAKQQFARAEAEYANISFNNLRNRIAQSQRELIAMRASAQNQINRLMPSPMQAVDTVAPQRVVGMPQYQAPSMTPFLIQGASGILGGVTTGYQLSAARGLGNPTETSVLGLSDIAQINIPISP